MFNEYHFNKLHVLNGYRTRNGFVIVVGFQEFVTYSKNFRNIYGYYWGIRLLNEIAYLPY